MKKSIQALIMAAAMLAGPMVFASCEEILGEWSRPAPNPVTPTPEPDPTLMLKTPLTLEAAVAGAKVTFKADNANVAKDIEYSTDGGATWTSGNTGGDGVEVTLTNIGDKVMFRGDNSQYGKDNETSNATYNSISCTADCYVYGNIMSLIDKTGFATNKVLPTGKRTFFYLFKDNTYLKNHPKRSLRFVFCGSEERGLYGSRAFVDQHPDEVKQTRLCCNVDMTGPVLGRDIVRITGEDKIVHAIDYYAKVNGHGATVYQDTYASDGMPYALCGVPAVNFYRKAAEGTTNIHSRNDTLSRITAKSLESTGKFIVEVMNTIINAEVFPFDRKLPENMEQKTKTLLSNMPGYKDKDKESSNNQAKK